jgi:hypothetical protein
LGDILYELSHLVHSEEHAERLEEVLDVVDDADYLDYREFISENIISSQSWAGRNLRAVDSWLNNGGTTDPSTSVPTSTDPTTSTTLGSASLAASIIFTGFCVLVKFVL